MPGLPVLILSQHVEQIYAAELLADGVGGVGYLLKDRVADVDDFVAAVRRVAGGGTVLDPEVVAQILARAPLDAIDSLTPREREVLALMAEGRSNQAIAEALVVTLGPSRSTSRASSESSSSPPTRRTTAGCWRCWRTCAPRANGRARRARRPT